MEYMPNDQASVRDKIRRNNDLAKPNNSREFLEFKAEAEQAHRYQQLKKKDRATKNRKPKTVLD